MKRSVVVLLSVLVVLASIGAGVGAWRLASNRTPEVAQISAYTNGHLVQTGPYLYCSVLDLGECLVSRSQGRLAADSRHTVQLSVDPAISRAPWRLVRLYEDPADTDVKTYRPNTTLAVTVPTVDPLRGPLTGLVVQVLTLAIDESGQIFDVPHAEWAMRMVWN